MTRSLRLLIGLLCATASWTAASTPAFAATRSWTGNGANNLWTTPQNWSGGVAPVSGDGLTFPPGALQTTNVNNYPAGTLFAAIQFNASYVVSGNRVLLGNNIRVAGANGVTVAFQCDITNGGGSNDVLFVDVNDGTILLTTGIISGPTPIQKVGEGLWNISGSQPNTFDGEVRVLAGTIVLNKPAGMAAVPSGLRISDNIGVHDGDVVRLASDRQIVGPVTIGLMGLLDLNGHFDSVGKLTLSQGHITTGLGELTLEDDVDAFGEFARIEGRLALGGPPRVFTTHGAFGPFALAIEARISALGGDGGIIKRGAGVMTLAADNDYGGLTRVEGGILRVLHAQALGIAAADAGTGVSGTGRIELGAAVDFEPLLLERNSATVHAVECWDNGIRAWRGPIHLTGSNGFSTSSSCLLRLGPISGTGEFWTTGNVLELAEAGSSYVGDTRVQSGTLRIGGPQRIPDTSHVRLMAAGTLNLNGWAETVSMLTGDSTSQVLLNAGTLTVATPANTTVTYPGIIRSNGTVVHSGAGTWILTGAHQYLGPTAVTGGTLQIDGSLHASSQVVISNGVLTGTGTTGVIAGVNGRFVPGHDGIGTFTTGSLAFAAGHTVDVSLKPAQSAPRIDAHGSVNLGSAALALDKPAGVQIDAPIVLIANDGTDAIGSTFAGLPEGSLITVDDQQFRLSYVGGSGNDIAIAPTELTYYLAEGSTGAFFDTEIALANPHQTTVPVIVEFLIEGGGQAIARDLQLAPMSRTTIAVDEIPGLEAAAVSTKVRSTGSPTQAAAPIVVERTMWWGGTRYGAHTEKASGGAAPRWYFAEGSQGFFFTFLLLANPIAQDNVATVRFLLEGGGEVVRTYTLAPLSRQTISASDIPELANQSFGMEVTFAQGGVAERAMYFGVEPFWLSGHESAGVTSPSTTWFLAEGATGPFFETFILLANPNAADADATVRFLPGSGTPVVKPVTVAAHARVTLNIEAQDASLANVPVATEVSSTLSIVAERAQYWPDPAPAWYEAHNSFGMTETATKWGLAEGRVGDPAAYQTYVLLANPTTTAATVTITFLRETGAPVVKQFTVNAQSRFNVAIANGGVDVPELANERFGALIESSIPIVVERALYANVGDQVWGAGTNATATRLP